MSRAKGFYNVSIGMCFSLQKAVLHLVCEPRGFGGSDLIAIADLNFMQIVWGFIYMDFSGMQTGHTV